MLLLVDASAVIGCVTDEPQRDALLRAAVDKILIAPRSLEWEIDNAFSAMFKLQRIGIEAALASI